MKFQFISTSWLLVILWIILTCFNINKAFHIDDAFHLEAAQWIGAHPTTPMSGFINWSNNPSSGSNANQPPLYFYLIAFVGELFGYSEIPLHIFQSIFTFLALWLFLKICTLQNITNTRTSLLFMAFCPGLMVNQNLMIDVPLLSLELAFVFFLLKSDGRRALRYYTLAALVLGCALLIKYSILPLLVVFLLIILAEKKYKYLNLGLIPVGILGLWSIFNLFEFQKVHIFNRPVSHFSIAALINQTIGLLSCIGAIIPFSIALYNAKLPYKIVEKLSYLSLFAFLFFCGLVYFDIIPERISSLILNILFVINGMGIALVMGSEIWPRFRKEGKWRIPEKADLIFILTFASIAAFTVKYAPFIATRHILLLIPFIILICRDLIDRIPHRIQVLSIGLSVTMGVLLTLSDWHYADFYRKISTKINVPAEGKIWVSGHWGWQWYSKNIAGGHVSQYATDSSMVHPGDYFIRPAVADQQSVNENLVLKEIQRIYMKPGFSTFFSGHKAGSMYLSFPKKGPWNLSKTPVDTIIISRVVGITK